MIYQIPTGTTKDVAEPIDYFSLFNTNDIVSNIVTHTNEQTSMEKSNYHSFAYYFTSFSGSRYASVMSRELKK